MIKYIVHQSDSFNPSLYPDVVKELAAINISIIDLENYYKSDIAISFWKDHCIKMDWIEENKQLIKTITSRSTSASCIESLFESCRGNKNFLRGFENYIKKELEA